MEGVGGEERWRAGGGKTDRVRKTERGEGGGEGNDEDEGDEKGRGG